MVGTFRIGYLDDQQIREGLGVDQVDNTPDDAKPVSADQQAAFDLKANIASPTFTGTPAAPTAAAGTNTTQLATTAFVRTEVSNLIASAPAALDTLDELAAALGDDANFAATVTTALAAKQPLDSDLTAIAALTTTAYGRALLTLADADALRALTRNACMVERATALAGQDWTAAATAITWDGESFDDGGWHDNATNPTRLTVPSGVTRVRVGFTITFQNLAASSSLIIGITKNGSAGFDGRIAEGFAAPADVNKQARSSASSGPIPVSAGDYFEVTAFLSGDTSVDVIITQSNFWAEAC